MDILDNIEKFIPNDEIIKGTFVNPNISKSHYMQVEGSVQDIPTTTTTTNIANDIAYRLSQVQPMDDDSWENMNHSIDEWDIFHKLVESGMSSEDAINNILDSTENIPDIKRGGKSTKKSKKKRKMAKASRRKNRKK